MIKLKFDLSLNLVINVEMDDNINRYSVFIVNSCLQNNFKLQNRIKDNKKVIIELQHTSAKNKYENQILQNQLLTIKNRYIYYKSVSIILCIMFIVYTFIFNYNYIYNYNYFGINNILKI